MAINRTPPQPPNEVDSAVGKATLMVIGFPFAVAIVYAFMIPLTLYAAFVGQAIWGWFVTPAFGLACPPLVQLAGCMLLVKLCVHRARDRRMTQAETDAKFGFLRWVAEGVFGISLAWLTGYVLHLLDAWAVFGS